MLKLDIPFIKSRGFECGQTCAAMMIKYFDPKFKPDFTKINKLIHHKKGMYTFPPQLALLLDSYNIQTKVFSSDDVKTTGEDSDQFHRWFGADYDSQIKLIDVESYNWMAEQIKQKDLFVKKASSFQDLLSEVEKGNLVGMPVDWNRATGKSGPYRGHFVVISGIDDKNLLIHDPDGGPHQVYATSIIKMAWEHPAIADDYLVAYGKKTVT